MQKELIILVNLGSPDSLNVNAIRRFLFNFLGDKRVVNLPKPLWYPILCGIILPFRAPKLLKKYKSIALENQSPLIHYSERIAAHMQTLYPDKYIEMAYSYSKKNVQFILAKYTREEIRSIKIIPLYPQYSSTTFAPIFDKITSFYKSKKFIPSISMLNSYYDNLNYIKALCISIQNYLGHNKISLDCLLVSFHSLPVKLVQTGDPYFTECNVTFKLLQECLRLNDEQMRISFQSKFGNAKWIGPQTSDVLTELAQKGKKSVAVVCPGFSVDCLETLEEISIENKQVFLTAGGVNYYYIPCLNDSNLGLALVKDLINKS